MSKFEMRVEFDSDDQLTKVLSWIAEAFEDLDTKITVTEMNVEDVTMEHPPE